MSRIKDKFFDEINNHDNNPFMYLDEMYEEEYENSSNKCELVIHIDAPDPKKAGNLLMDIIRDIKSDDYKGSGSFQYPDDSKVSYTWYKLNK